MYVFDSKCLKDFDNHLFILLILQTYKRPGGFLVKEIKLFFSF